MSETSPPLQLSDEEQTDSGGDVVELPPPDLKKTRFGKFGEMWALRRHIKKRQKLIKKGYVQWYLIDDTFPEPKFVKPEPQGGTMRELKHDGDRYLFPREAMLPSERQGMWTVVHKLGEADPINMRDPARNAIPSDALQEYITMRPSASPPSFFDKLDMDIEDAMKYVVFAFIAIAILNSVLNGGMM